MQRKLPRVYKDSPSYNSWQQWRHSLNLPSPVSLLLTALDPLENLYPVTDGGRSRDPQPNTGLSSWSPAEEREEGL